MSWPILPSTFVSAAFMFTPYLYFSSFSFQSRRLVSRNEGDISSLSRARSFISKIRPIHMLLMSPKIPTIIMTSTSIGLGFIIRFTLSTTSANSIIQITNILIRAPTTSIRLKPNVIFALAGSLANQMLVMPIAKFVKSLKLSAASAQTDILSLITPPIISTTVKTKAITTTMLSFRSANLCFLIGLICQQ